MTPTPEQLRREYDRRGISGRVRPWPPCRGTLSHRLAALQVRRWSDDRITHTLHRMQVRFDPPRWARDCCEGTS